MAHVIRTGIGEFYPIIDDDLIDSVEASDDERDVVRELALKSSIAVPIIKRGRVLGGLQLLMTNSRRHYTDDDFTLANAIASRLAASIDNMRLRDAQRSIASTLQASLLPTVLPQITGVDIAVRYWATGHGVDVGGDFYDVFLLLKGNGRLSSVTCAGPGRSPQRSPVWPGTPSPVPSGIATIMAEHCNPEPAS